jgi:putative hemolysin
MMVLPDQATPEGAAHAMWVEITLVVVLILLNAGLSGSEMAFVTLRESQVNRLAADGERGRKLAILTADPNRFLSTIQVGITLAGFLASATAAVSLAQPLIGPLTALGSAAEPVAVFVVTLVLSYLTLVLGELAPKRIAMQTAPQWALRAAGPITVIATLVRPVVWLLAWSTAVVVRMFGLDPHAAREEVSEEELKDMIAAQESIPAQQRSIIEGALELDERRLWQVLVPRSDVVFVTSNQDTATARDHLIEAGLSRAPVIGSTEDDVIGFVHLRQLVAGVGIVADYIRPALVLPDSVGVLQALGRMQQQRGQLALVVDEFGSVAGIVTLEDLLEEIVGEIYDEFDKDTAAVVRTPDGEIELAGSFPAHDLPDLGVDLEAGRHATIAGIMLEEIGEFPPIDTTITVGEWRLTALEVTPRAILRVKLARVTPEAAETEDAPQHAAAEPAVPAVPAAAPAIDDPAATETSIQATDSAAQPDLPSATPLTPAHLSTPTPTATPSNPGTPGTPPRPATPAMPATPASQATPITPTT